MPLATITALTDAEAQSAAPSTESQKVREADQFAAMLERIDLISNGVYPQDEPDWDEDDQTARNG